MCKVAKKCLLVLFALFVIVQASPSLADGTIYQTEHFSYELPSEWALSSSEGNMKFTNGDKVLAFTEVNLVSDGYYQNSQKSTVYNMFRNSLVADTYAEAQQVEIDGDYAVAINHPLNNGELEATSILYYMNGYVLFAMLSSPLATNEDRYNEACSLASNFRYKFAKEPSQVTLMNSFVRVIGSSIRESLGNLYLVTEYQWINYSKEPQAFFASVSTEAYQNGVQCSTGFISGLNSNTTTKIETNRILTCYDIHVLNDSSSPVTIYIDQFFDIADQYDGLKYTVNLK